MYGRFHGTVKTCSSSARKPRQIGNIHGNMLQQYMSWHTTNATVSPLSALHKPSKPHHPHSVTPLKLFPSAAAAAVCTPSKCPTQSPQHCIPLSPADPCAAAPASSTLLLCCCTHQAAHRLPASAVTKPRANVGRLKTPWLQLLLVGAQVLLPWPPTAWQEAQPEAAAPTPP
jgi:hypothetical protein